MDEPHRILDGSRRSSSSIRSICSPATDLTCCGRQRYPIASDDLGDHRASFLLTSRYVTGWQGQLAPSRARRSKPRSKRRNRAPSDSSRVECGRVLEMGDDVRHALTDPTTGRSTAESRDGRDARPDRSARSELASTRRARSTPSLRMGAPSVSGAMIRTCGWPSAGEREGAHLPEEDLVSTGI